MAPTVGRVGASIQEDARAQLGLARRGRAALPVTLVARADAQAGEEKVPIGLPLPDLTMDQFMDIEDGWSMREDSV
jgi:hypothetical protein